MAQLVQHDEQREAENELGYLYERIHLNGLIWERKKHAGPTWGWAKVVKLHSGLNPLANELTSKGARYLIDL